MIKRLIVWNFPETDINTILKKLDQINNYRVCENTYQLVTIYPFPKESGDIFASSELCQNEMFSQ